MGFNINSYSAVLNSIAKITTNNGNSTARKTSNVQISQEILTKVDNIFAKYEAEKAKEEQANENGSNSGNKYVGNLNIFEVANMSTKDFLNYAYENRANSGYDQQKQQDNEQNIKLPMVVRYKTQVVTTAGKTFMQVVSDLSAKFPGRDKKKIAAELLAKYSNNGNGTSGSTINMSA